jgi:hypothetical protein
MATKYQANMYADDRFFHCAAALDGMHRRWVRSTTKYVDRLKALAGTGGDTFVNLVRDVDTWADRVVVERDDHAHHLVNAAQTTGATRYYLAGCAYWLLIVVLLRECHFPQPVFRAIEKSAEFDWVRRGLVGII